MTQFLEVSELKIQATWIDANVNTIFIRQNLITLISFKRRGTPILDLHVNACMHAYKNVLKYMSSQPISSYSFFMITK
jgi:hypothetical protein